MILRSAGSGRPRYVVFALSLAGLVGCGSTTDGGDVGGGDGGGGASDVASRVDAGGVRDAGGGRDSGPSLDWGTAVDTGPRVDRGTVTDVQVISIPDVGPMQPLDTGPEWFEDAGVDAGAPEDTGPVVPAAAAVLELRALDIWAQPLPEGGYTLEVRRDGSAVSTQPGSSAATVTVPLTGAATYEVSLSATDFRPLTVTVSFDGTMSDTGAVVRGGTGAAGSGQSFGHATRTVDGRPVMVHSLNLGLRHLWFSAQGRPARRGNDLRLLMDGEEAYAAVHQDLLRARETIHASTWWWESNFELTRPASTHVTSTTAQRQANTVLSIFEQSPATKRVIVGQFLSMDGTFSTLSSDAALRAHGTTRGDRFEYMGQANETRGMFQFEVRPFRYSDRVRAEVAGAAGLRFDAESLIASTVPPHMVDLTHWPIMADVLAASYHQKFMVIDGTTSYIGGMNLRRVDWDTSAHRVFEPRRMLFDATTANRQAVANRTRASDTGPRKDYMLRIQGPIVRDAADVFRRRWQFLIDSRARYSDDATSFANPPVPAPVSSGGVMAQVTATLPAPFYEHAMAETWFNAVANAREYIFIEDQYFRIPMLVERIVQRMTEVPTLRVVVITKPLSEWTDPGCAWTRRTHEALLSRFPTRYTMLQLRAFDTEVTWGIDETECRFLDMDTHSKMLIVDDVFMSVGSANKNNRGIVYEGELNVAVYDRAWVRDARRRILANMLPPGATVSDTASVWYSALLQAASYNDAVRARWTQEGDDISLDGRALPSQYRPLGFVYTLPMREVSQCLIEDIGPDVV